MFLLGVYLPGIGQVLDLEIIVVFGVLVSSAVSLVLLDLTLLELDELEVLFLLFDGKAEVPLDIVVEEVLPMQLQIGQGGNARLIID